MGSFDSESPSIDHDDVFVVGLVGGIGSGKSAVAVELARRFPSILINADRVGHHVLTLSNIKAQIRETFGESVFNGDEVNRNALARVVFVSPTEPAGTPVSESGEELSPLQRLERIVHPEIQRQIDVQIDSFRKSSKTQSSPLIAESETIPKSKTVSPTRIVVLDAPVMFEAGWDAVCDYIVFLDTPFEVRLERIKDRGWTRDELIRREANQWTMEEKRAKSHFWVDNTQPVEKAVDQIQHYLESSIA